MRLLVDLDYARTCLISLCYTQFSATLHVLMEHVFQMTHVIVLLVTKEVSVMCKVHTYLYIIISKWLQPGLIKLFQYSVSVKGIPARMEEPANVMSSLTRVLASHLILETAVNKTSPVHVIVPMVLILLLMKTLMRETTPVHVIVLVVRKAHISHM